MFAGIDAHKDTFAVAVVDADPMQIAATAVVNARLGG